MKFVLSFFHEFLFKNEYFIYESIFSQFIILNLKKFENFEKITKFRVFKRSELSKSICLIFTT